MIRNIVVLTGAGISAESGLATFRGPGGLWEGHRVEDVCTLLIARSLRSIDYEFGPLAHGGRTVLKHLLGNRPCIRDRGLPLDKPGHGSAPHHT